MKKIFTLALVAMVALSASAAKKKGAEKNANKPVFIKSSLELARSLPSIKRHSIDITC